MTDEDFQAQAFPAMVMACIATVLALAGTGYAALSIPRNSVGANQLKRNAVSSPKVRNGSLRKADLATGVITATTPLRSGETAIGAIGADDENFVAGGDFAATANLPAPAPVSLADTTVDADGGLDEVGGRCTGSAATPTAPPGIVCIYNEGSGNAASVEGFASSDNGFIVHWTAPATGDTFYSGVWAYTAP